MPRATRDDDPPVEKVFVSTKEAAHLLGVSRNHIYELLNQQAIESRYLGKRRLVMMTSLRKFMDDLPAERGA